MGARAETLSAEVARASDATLAAAAALDASAWRTPTAGGWTVGVVFSHLAESYAQAGYLIVQIVAGARPATQSEAQIEASDARGSQLAAGVTRADVLQRLQQNGAMITTLIQTLDDASLDQAAPLLTDGPSSSVKQVIEANLLHHIAGHLRNVRLALEAI